VFPIIPPAPAPAPAPAPLRSRRRWARSTAPCRWSSATAACRACSPKRRRTAYEAAADAGADSLETDLHLTKDCVLVARHNPWLSDNTNIADVAKTNPTVAARKRTVPACWST
jgi:glycerophosphoryl diester phosphodiesterase